jgi:hypothetical protein
MQRLVKENAGIAFLPQGSALDPALTLRPILGADWSLANAITYRKDTTAKSIPFLIRELKRQPDTNGHVS